MTQVYDCSDETARAEGIAAARAALLEGRLVVLPTDTVYGLAADAFSVAGVSMIFEAKGRGRDMPPPVLISAASTVNALVVDLPEHARALTERFWPGALTLVGRQQQSLQWDLGDTRGTVAVRMPDDPLALELLERTGPLAVSSANATGEPAATTAEEAQRQLGDSVEVYVDGGSSPGGEPSTILDVTGDRPRVLRLGAISVAELDEVLEPLGVAIEDQPDGRPTDLEE